MVMCPIPEPLVITGASGQVGRALVAALQHRGIRAQALVRRPAGLTGCDEYSDWMTSPEAEQALASASAVVHLAGNLKPARGDYAAANVATSERVAASISPATCRRIVFLSFLGADPGSANAYLASKGAAEASLRSTGVPITILRCSHIVGPPDQPGPTASSLIAGDWGLVTVVGSGRQRWAPVALADVVDAILAALEQGADGTFDLQGPEVYGLNHLIALLNRGRRVRRLRIPAWLARLLRFAGLPKALIEVLLADCVSPGPPGVAMAAPAFGLQLTSLRAFWR